MNQPENNNVIFETLEPRSMMSAVALVHAPVQHSAPAIHVSAKKPAPKPNVTPQLPPLQVDPTPTDHSIKYTSFATSPLFSSTGPSPDDVNQGDLGDCYFLSTLSAIAKVDPARIRNDIVDNNDGTYTVDFTSSKGVKPIRVSANLPTWFDGGLAYAGVGAGNSLWVAIMEKAYADFRTTAHSYASIDGGWMSEVFTALGIKSQATLSATRAPALATQIAGELKAGQAVTYATGFTIQDGAPLVVNHAYEVDGINVDKTGAPVSIRLRNPWGVDGAGSDGADDGYVTITVKQAYDNFDGMVAAKA